MVNCNMCHEDFFYLKPNYITNFRKLCDTCVKSKKYIYQKEYLQLIKDPPKIYCPVCKIILKKTGAKCHQECHRKYKKGDYQVTRQWWQEHIQKGVVDDEACVLI